MYHLHLTHKKLTPLACYDSDAHEPILIILANMLERNFFTLKARYDLNCVESAVKLQPTNQPGEKLINKKHLKNVGPIRHCEPPHAHSPGVVSGTIACCLRIDVQDIDNDNA